MFTFHQSVSEIVFMLYAGRRSRLSLTSYIVLNDLLLVYPIAILACSFGCATLCLGCKERFLLLIKLIDLFVDILTEQNACRFLKNIIQTTFCDSFLTTQANQSNCPVIRIFF